MAHMLDFSKGFAAIAVRTGTATPWHQEAQWTDADAPMEVWQRNSGADYTVKATSALYDDGNGIVPATGHSILLRSDTLAHLGAVSDDFKIHQPADIFGTAKQICEAYGYKMETAGVLRGGRVLWILASVGVTMRINGNDVVNGYVLITTAFDGSMATTGRFTTIRVVCNNTLQAALASIAHLRISHRSHYQPQRALHELALAGYRQFEDEAGAMANKKIEPQQAVNYLLGVYHDMTAAEVAALKDGRQKTEIDKTVTRLAGILANAPGALMQSANGTAWGLLNAVTHDVDFVKSARSPDNRLYSAWYAQGAALKQKAYQQALALAA